MTDLLPMKILARAISVEWMLGHLFGFYRQMILNSDVKIFIPK